MLKRYLNFKNINLFNRYYCNTTIPTPESNTKLINNTTTTTTTTTTKQNNEKITLIKKPTSFQYDPEINKFLSNLKPKSKYIPITSFILDKSIDLKLIYAKKPDEPIKMKNRYLIVGLGNPGAEYNNTRHNIGFDAIDQLATLLNTSIENNYKNHCLLATSFVKLDEKPSSHKIKIQNQQRKQQHLRQIEILSDLKNQGVDLTTITDIPLDNNNESMEQPPNKVINQVVMIKPQKYMNLSGGSVRAVATEFNIPLENILVLVDDCTMKVGQIQMKERGGSGGQNGMDNIITKMASERVNRIKIGVGIPRPGEVLSNFVLKKFSIDDKDKIFDSVDHVARLSLMWMERGIKYTMNVSNKN
ncbi:hypothetical protein CYY_010338 [Polysphondylium violaceum]|uniref:peptidyl-tRNA hydrolase n=1 Tax=Polysphondylium violaceum TaxID=133409 RepID=A0A8J4PRR9_9MYCE|nr:hypothetical protein CYY_010338 [Polysphondylium violaceum]